jgi:hypothetical protein
MKHLLRRTRVLDCLHTHLQALLQRVSGSGIVPLVRDMTAFETRLAESTPDTMVLKRTCCITPLPANCTQKQQTTDQQTSPRESISPEEEKKTKASSLSHQNKGLKSLEARGRTRERCIPGPRRFQSGR